MDWGLGIYFSGFCNLNLIQNPCMNGIYSDEAKAVKNNHRNVVLQQGRANFGIDSDGLTALQKVDLYCFYYFQMFYFENILHHILYSSTQGRPYLIELYKKIYQA